MWRVLLIVVQFFVWKNIFQMAAWFTIFYGKQNRIKDKKDLERFKKMECLRKYIYILMEVRFYRLWCLRKKYMIPTFFMYLLKNQSYIEKLKKISKEYIYIHTYGNEIRFNEEYNGNNDNQF